MFSAFLLASAEPARTRHHSFFDFRPEASIVELDPAGVTFRLNKILLHLLRELRFFGCGFAAGSLMVHGKLRAISAAHERSRSQEMLHGFHEYVAASYEERSVPSALPPPSVLLAVGKSQQTTLSDFAAARQQMVEQLSAPGRDIKNCLVLDAMASVPRDEFMPARPRITLPLPDTPP